MWSENSDAQSSSTDSTIIHQFAKFFRTSVVAFEETAAFVGGFVILCFITLTLTRMTVDILNPFLWACLAVTILQPVCNSVHKYLYKCGLRTRCWKPPRPLCALVVLFVFSGFLCLLAYISFSEVQVVMENKEFYKIGFDYMEKVLLASAERVGTTHPEIRDEFFSQVLARGRQQFDKAVEHINHTAAHTAGSFFFSIMYVVFWLLSEPTGVAKDSEGILRKFLYFKGIVGGLYSIFIYLFLRFYANIDMPSTMAFLNVWFHFIPTVGSVIASLFPAPLILGDSRQETPGRTFVIVVVVQLVVQFFFKFLGELIVYSFSLDRHFRIHPVIILFTLGVFGFMLGASGMLLAVPCLAYLKAMAYSGDLPRIYRDFVLVSLEGDYTAIYRCDVYESQQSRLSFPEEGVPEEGVPTRPGARVSFARPDYHAIPDDDGPEPFTKKYALDNASQPHNPAPEEMVARHSPDTSPKLFTEIDYARGEDQNLDRKRRVSFLDQHDDLPHHRP